MTFNPLAGFDLNPWDGEDEIPGKAADGAKALIDELHSALDPKAYRKAVALLAESEFIDIFGVENSLTPAMDLFTKLGYLGLTCRLNTDAYLQQIGAGHLPHGAVAVAFSHSGSSADTVKALRLAKSHGAKTIAITNAIGAPLTSWADVTLLTGRDSHTIYGNAIFSRVADTALVDMLYMGVILSDYGRFSTALRRIRSHDSRSRIRELSCCFIVPWAVLLWSLLLGLLTIWSLFALVATVLRHVPANT